MDEGESTEGVLFPEAFCFHPTITAGAQQFGDKYSLWPVRCTWKQKWSAGRCLVGSCKFHPFILLCRRKTKIPDEAPRPPVPSPGRERQGPVPPWAQYTAGCPEVVGGVLLGLRIQLWVGSSSCQVPAHWAMSPLISNNELINYTKKI